MTKIYGHQDKKDFFVNLVEHEQLGHAYIFYGDSQIGKFLFALSLANFVEGGEFEKTDKTLLDSVFIDKNEKGNIGIESFRDLKKFIFQKPLKSKKRLVIVNDADKMTFQAQGSILKTVEESPEHVTFIFITNNPDALLTPLRSRLVKIYFSRLKNEEIKEYVKNQLGKDISAEEVQQSFGRIGRLFNKGNIYYKDQSLGEYLEGEILKLYFKDKVKNHRKIFRLLKKELELKTFNLNHKLQEKVIKEIK